MTRATLVRRNRPQATSVPVRPFFRGFESLFNDDLFRPFGGALSSNVEGQAAWLPAMDIRESKEAYTVTAELAGMSKKDFEITVEDNILTVSGERSFENESEDENYHRIERSYGSFARSFGLPEHVKSDGIKAEFKEGLLKVTLPKTEQPREKQIDVKIG